MAEKSGAVRLLVNEDHGTSLIGWQPASVGLGGLVNKKGWAMLRVVVQKVVEGRLRDLYDQPVLVESPGAVVVCRVGDRIGLAQNFRFVGERILQAGADYVRRLDDERRWEDLLSTLGSWRWELPQGLAPPDNNENDLEKFILKTAQAEALEEAGFTVASSRIVGRVNTNPTFFAHSQYVVLGDIVAQSDQRPEDLEIIGKVRLFSPQEIRKLVDSGELDNGLTLAALAVAGVHF